MMYHQFDVLNSLAGLLQNQSTGYEYLLQVSARKEQFWAPLCLQSNSIKTSETSNVNYKFKYFHFKFYLDYCQYLIIPGWNGWAGVDSSLKKLQIILGMVIKHQNVFLGLWHKIWETNFSRKINFYCKSCHECLRLVSSYVSEA